MRILIDMQGAQSGSRFRGIGRYTIGFTKAVIKNRGEHEIFLLLNGLLPESVDYIRSEFKNILPSKNFKVWFAPEPISESERQSLEWKNIAEKIRESYISSLNPDIVHISSFFEGFGDNAVLSINQKSEPFKTSVMLYDLIPLVDAEKYLEPNLKYKAFYLDRVNNYKKADVFFAISDFSKEVGMKELLLSDDQIIDIGCAIDEKFANSNSLSTGIEEFKGKNEPNKPFILYTGGADFRKNLPRLIKAYSLLETNLKRSYQLVIAGKISEGEYSDLVEITENAGLAKEDVAFTGYVTDEELISLYQTCALFVFPSWNEGFGLPLLEAMACGAVVIGSNTSSIPSLIAWDEALFNPYDELSISNKIKYALENTEFRSRSILFGEKQKLKYSWDITATKAIDSWNLLLNTIEKSTTDKKPLSGLRKMAYVSPLPPERTGIADYSFDLLPELSKFYKIYVVTDQQFFEPSIQTDFEVKSTAWFGENFKEIDRVVYQMGNSPFHSHMLGLISDFPGIVVLHDFYLSGLYEWVENFAMVENFWADELYESHGYKAIGEKFKNVDVKLIYPVSYKMFAASLGVIVHSRFSKSLKELWFPQMERSIDVIPHLREPRVSLDKKTVRSELGLEEDDFLICSFGHLAPTKLNMDLLDCWTRSSLGKEGNSKLIFVGENEGGQYGEDLLNFIQSNNLTDRVKITGFASKELYQKYLTVSNVAVQLRTDSRGETSGAVLDCLNYSLPVIVNANGSMAEIDSSAVVMLQDKFQDTDLIDALEELWQSEEKRIQLSYNAEAMIKSRHLPEICAVKYFDSIEKMYATPGDNLKQVIDFVSGQLPEEAPDRTVQDLAVAISKSFPCPNPKKRLFLDISATSRNDLKTGIERVARALVSSLINLDPNEYRIEPVYLDQVDGEWVYRLAKNFTFRLLDVQYKELKDEIIDPQSGDIVLILDMSGGILLEAKNFGLFKSMQLNGVKIYSVLYDLLPVETPQFFPSFSKESHQNHLTVLSELDGILCISEVVRANFKKWLFESVHPHSKLNALSIKNVYLGADLENSFSTFGFPENAEELLQCISERITFLMVGTIEPRKGYMEVIIAFEKLWDSGLDLNLVIIGKEGWKGLPDYERLEILNVVNYLSEHPLLNKRIFWLDNASDELLKVVYAKSTCLIAASYAEGFGLPLIEAAQQGLPIIARDISVFREVAQQDAFYFDDGEVSVLSEAIQNWLVLYESNSHPKSDNLSWITWEESAKRLITTLLEDV
jgi:glycosyltransferase involved in cell wall biosynthesis